MSYKIGEDTIFVRKGEELDLSILERFLRRKIEDLPEAPLEILQFSAGHSNLTYQLKIGGWEAVLRRPPLGPVAPKAHDMKREHLVISELHPYFEPAPRPILFSEDKTIVGTPFFIMERKHGLVFDTSFPEGFQATPEKCRRLSEIMVDKLVELHSIPYQKTGLSEISKPDGFMERQVHGWISRYLRAKTDDIPEVEPLLDWLAKHIPSNGEATIIHYDYKLNNAMINEEITDMVGLFDWEMTTVGDPLADLGVAMGYWTENSDPAQLKSGLGKTSVTVLEGFMTRKQFIEAYANKSGRDISNIDFYLTFAYFKLAVIIQQIYYRYKKGQTNDPRFSHFNTFVKSLILHAGSIAVKEAK
ncbi:phosphotransferase family protein [Peribacillus cavernae]|uniref:Phosphotransferase family protein n=1 Tax=Peribacillus cavernae TaxID=1674310 RepID=A0A3S1B847_9BACI|nr:phosphotransferase family protein [Peribacillus cavernae]MDQ0217306.1 aminoglycoside phosphotransferase (APT) family kinase protein [Peribacillus cavernae]RUQ30232.1 phosphotransferase family protein [Peribacillus cavernae]